MLFSLPLTSVLHFQMDGFPPRSEGNRSQSLEERTRRGSQGADPAQPPTSAPCWSHLRAPGQAQRAPLSQAPELPPPKGPTGSSSSFGGSWDTSPKDNRLGAKVPNAAARALLYQSSSPQNPSKMTMEGAWSFLHHLRTATYNVLRKQEGSSPISPFSSLLFSFLFFPLLSFPFFFPFPLFFFNWGTSAWNS